MLEGPINVLPENKWLSLPKALWLKVYEYLFLDLELSNKIYFNFVCRLFDQLTRDPDFIKALINRYYPYLTDSPDFDKNPQVFLPFLRQHLVLNYRINTPEEYLGAYFIAKVTRGAALRASFSELRAKLLKMYSKRTKNISFIERMNKAINSVDENLMTSLYSWLSLSTQRDHSVGDLSEKHLVSLTQCFGELCNFRALVALFNPAYLTPNGLRGLQRAAALSDLSLLKALMQQKEASFRQAIRNGEPVDEAEDPNKNETLLAITHHLEKNDLESIRTCLETDSLDTENIKKLLNSPQMCERIATWKFDDIFKEMTVSTFQALQKLVGIGGFQDAMVVPLARNTRADLIQLLTVSTLPTSVRLISDAFINAQERWRKETSCDPTSESSTRCNETMTAMRRNISLFAALLHSPVILLWLLNLEATDPSAHQLYVAKTRQYPIPLHVAHSVAQRFYIPESLSSFELHEYDETHKQCVVDLTEWACKNARLDILESLIKKSHGLFIKILVTAISKEFHSFLIDKINNMGLIPSLSHQRRGVALNERMKYKAALFVKAAICDDAATIDDLLTPYVRAHEKRKLQSENYIYSSELEEPLEEAAELAIELRMTCLANEKARSVLLKIVKIAKFSGNKVACVCEPLFLNIFEWAIPSYLVEFIDHHCKIAANPYIYWFEFIKRIQKMNNSALNEAIGKQMIFVLRDEYSSCVIKNDTLFYLYWLIVKDPILLGQINDHPEWLLPSFRHFHLIVRIFWPRLTVNAKEKLLSIRPGSDGNTVLSLFRELDTHYPEAKLFQNWESGVSYLLGQVSDVSANTAAPVLSAFHLRNSAEMPPQAEKLKSEEKREIEVTKDSDDDNPKKKKPKG